MTDKACFVARIAPFGRPGVTLADASRRSVPFV
jgi:hypothetical protein